MADAALSVDRITCPFVARDGGGKRYPAVQDTSLAIAPGEFVSVVGPTGCGKSTLLNVGAGLLAPSSGQVKVFGQPPSGINTRAGYMLQGAALLPRSEGSRGGTECVSTSRSRWAPDPQKRHNNYSKPQ